MAHQRGGKLGVRSQADALATQVVVWVEFISQPRRSVLVKEICTVRRAADGVEVDDCAEAWVYRREVVKHWDW